MYYYQVPYKRVGDIGGLPKQLCSRRQSFHEFDHKQFGECRVLFRRKNLVILQALIMENRGKSKSKD